MSVSHGIGEVNKRDLCASDIKTAGRQFTKRTRSRSTSLQKRKLAEEAAMQSEVLVLGYQPAALLLVSHLLRYLALYRLRKFLLSLPGVISLINEPTHAKRRRQKVSVAEQSHRW
jgi:hypothetical protein